MKIRESLSSGHVKFFLTSNYYLLYLLRVLPHRYVPWPLSSLEYALTSKLRVLPVFSRIGPAVSPLFSAVADRAETKPLESALTEKGEGVPHSTLKVKLQRQLELPRVEHGPRRPVQRVRRTFQISRCAGAAESRRIHGAEIRRAIYRVEEPDIRRVEKVERLRDQFQVSLFAKGNSARDPEIDGTEIVADKRVAWLDADAVVVAEDVSVGVEAGEFGEAVGRLNRGDQAEKEIARKWIPGLRSCDRPVHHHAVAHVVGGDGAFRTKILAVLRYQHKAGIRPVVDGLGPGVANAVGKVVCQPPVHIDEQAVILRVPSRCSFKIDCDRKGAHTGREWAGKRVGAIQILRPRAALRIVQSNDRRGVWLVHVEEAAEVNPADVQSANAYGRIPQWFKFEGQAGLPPVRVLVILVKAHNHGRPKESALRQRGLSRKTTVWEGNSIRIRSGGKELL